MTRLSPNGNTAGAGVAFFQDSLSRSSLVMALQRFSTHWQPLIEGKPQMPAVPDSAQAAFTCSGKVGLSTLTQAG